MRILGLLLLLLCIKWGQSIIPEDANTCVWLSAAAYCGKGEYETMKLGGPATGIVIRDVLYDEPTDMQGFIGQRDANIYVVFRGSSSAENWVKDLEVRLVDYPHCPLYKNLASLNFQGSEISLDRNLCQVHRGFYDIIQNMKNDTIDKIGQLIKHQKNANVFFSGHSLGSIAQLMAVEFALVYPNAVISAITFGQPRMGNKAFAEYVVDVVPEFVRFTHDRDVVPHVPPPEMEYVHSCGEIFEDATGKLRVCNVEGDSNLRGTIENCENPLCADQYKLAETDVADHMVYLGHPMNCNASTVR